MTQEQHEYWEAVYRECVKRDMLREAYRQADIEDAKEHEREVTDENDSD